VNIIKNKKFAQHFFSLKSLSKMSPNVLRMKKVAEGIWVSEAKPFIRCYTQRTKRA